MKRRQLFEFEDLAWFPVRIRNYMTDFLRTVAEKFNLFGAAVPVIAELLDNTGTSTVVDLASGAGGQWRTLAPQIAESRNGFKVTLTDRYPNVRALQLVKQSHPDLIEVESHPVDATDVTRSLPGVRTMFLSLHHFPPELATQILGNAVTSNSPIAVFEAQQRDIKHLIQFCFSPLMVLAITPLVRPISFGRILFTYLAPIVPLAIGWDGIASVFRTYSTKEMRKMAADADPGELFEWETRIVSNGPQVVPYLVGKPKASGAASEDSIAN